MRKTASKQGKAQACPIDSLHDLNTANAWALDARQVASLWRKEAPKEGFAAREDKLLNILRSAFDVAIYSHEDPKARKAYEGGEWTTFQRGQGHPERIAIRQKPIKRLADLNAENVKRLTTAALLELIDRNFGGGWEAIPEQTRNIIETAFDISTLKLPTSRIHTSGGTYQRKITEGYEALDITQGTWTEAIFARQKEQIELDPDDEEEDDYLDEEPLSPDAGDDAADASAEGEEEPDEEPQEGYSDDDSFYDDYMEEEELTEDEEADDSYIMEDE